jgi:ribosomal-protein-alanine N-acetyltransferase
MNPSGAIGPTELHTERLLLRPFQLGDAADVFAYSKDEEFCFYLTPGPPPGTLTEVEQDLARIVRLPWRDYPHFAIVLNGVVVGAVNLKIEHSDQIANLGYAVARDCWGKGLATEATRAIVDYGFRTFRLAKVFARADPRNVGSVRVLEKLGMQREGLLRSHHIRRGDRVDRVFYGLLRAEWEAASGWQWRTTAPAMA